MAEQQETFDWTQESAECVEGMKFDEAEVYTFVLDSINPRVVTTKKGDKRKLLGLEWVMQEAKLRFKMDLWVNDRERVNPDNPEIESQNVKLARRLGYSPVLGGKFNFADFLKIGMQINAKVKPRVVPGKDGGADRTFNDIDVDTITTEGTSQQQSLPERIPDAIYTEILAISKGCKNQKALIEKINKMGAKDSSKFALVSPALQMVEQGKIPF